MFVSFVLVLTSGLLVFGPNHDINGKQIHSHKVKHVFLIIFIVSLPCLVLSSISVCAQNYMINRYNERTEYIEIVTNEN